MNDILYHYCSIETAMNILINENVRMTDVTKSNDSDELRIFYPMIFDAFFESMEMVEKDFSYGGIFGKDALYKFINAARDRWQERYEHQSHINFFLCFSETSDTLSQWRGYADETRGVCIGFSKTKLEEFCHQSDGRFALQKITYISYDQKREICLEKAKYIINECREAYMRKKGDDKAKSEFVDRFMDYLLGSFFTDSLKYKDSSFSEEREWRIFLQNKWSDVEGNDDFAIPHDLLVQNIENDVFLKEHLDFNSTKTNLIPFLKIPFEAISADKKELIMEVILGPQNKTKTVYMYTFLNHYGYYLTHVNRYQSTYRYE